MSYPAGVSVSKAHGLVYVEPWWAKNNTYKTKTMLKYKVHSMYKK